MSAFTHDIQTQWTAIRPILTIRNEHEYNLAVKRLDELLDKVGTNEQHPLYGLLDTLGTLSGPMRKNTIPCRMSAAQRC